MEFLWKTDWGRLFIPEMSLPEILIRGTLIYLAICFLLRIVLKRQAGKVSLSDLLVVTIIAGVCRNPLVRDAYSVTDGVLVVTTVLCWSFLLDWLSYHVPLVHNLLHAPPVLLIQNGQILQKNLQQELVTESQLCCKLRQEGLREPAEVAEAWMEGDGHISVIKKQPEASPAPPTQSLAETPLEHAPQSEPFSEGQSGPGDESPADADAVQAFLQAARTLEAQVARHQQAIAERQERIAEIQALLGQFGFRLKKTGSSSRSRKNGKSNVVAPSEDVATRIGWARQTNHGAEET